MPTVILSGPLLARLMVRWVPIMAPGAETSAQSEGEGEGNSGQSGRPSFLEAVSVIILPVLLMLAASVVDLAGLKASPAGRAIVWVGTPLEALTITTVYAMVLLAFRAGWAREKLNSIVGSSFASIAGILLIVAAGGGFKQTLVDSGIIAPLAVNLSPVQLSLLVLAIGAGSIFLSHVNDAGFWLVKEYFGMTVGQTFKTWSLMETALSVCGLVIVLLVSVVVH